MRQIVLDTETTGLELSAGHRIVEIGCVEIINRRITKNRFHCYLQPDREIDNGAFEVHGIANEFLLDKPRFSDVVDEFLAYINGGELIIHNAPFDTGFLDHELMMLGDGFSKLSDYCAIVDTLVMARRLHPGKKNSLDALCNRYDVDNTRRELHGALLDAEILADVYLAMTGGQSSLLIDDYPAQTGLAHNTIRRLGSDRSKLIVIYADVAEQEAHRQRLAAIREANGGNCVWLRD